MPVNRKPNVKVRWALAIVLILTAAVSLAQEAPASRDDILRLFDIMQIREQMIQAMQQAAQQMRAMNHDALKKRHPAITDADLAELDAMSEQTMQDIPIDGMIEDVIPVYQKHLTRADVDAMIAFYSTPTGRKIMHEMPAMAAEGMQATYPRLQKQMDETMDKVERMAREAEHKKEAPQPAQAPEKRKD